MVFLRIPISLFLFPIQVEVIFISLIKRTFDETDTALGMT